MQADPTEEIFFVGKTSRWGYFMYYFSGFVLVLGAGCAKFVFKTQENALIMGMFAWLFLIGGVACFLYSEIKRKIKKIIVTNKRVLLLEGILRKHSTSIRYPGITEVILEQKIMGRLLGYGSLEINTSGVKHRKLTIEKLGNAVKIKDKIEGLMHPSGINV